MAKIEAIYCNGIYNPEEKIPYIFINEIRLDLLLSIVKKDYEGLHPSWLNWYDDNFEPNKEEKEYVWEHSKLDKGTQVLPILLCPDDWDFYCTVILVEVIPSKDKVIWNRFGQESIISRSYIENGRKVVINEADCIIDETGKEIRFSIIEWFSEIGPYEFDRTDYENCIQAFKNYKRVL